MGVGGLRRTVVIGLVAVLGLSACSSTPSAQRIALDLIDTLEVDEPVKECMRDAVRAYSQDELQQIAELADAGDTDGVADLARFEASLRACRR